jgi:hypothetical protein
LHCLPVHPSTLVSVTLVLVLQQTRLKDDHSKRENV